MAAHARVLVFDGPRRTLEPLTLWLLERGFVVCRSDQADQALALLGANGFELVVADAEIANGPELAAAVRSDPATRHLAVVLVADGPPAGAAAQALAIGADDVLAPDQNEAELLARLRTLSRLSVMETELRRREAVLRRFGVEPGEPRTAPPVPERLRILLIGEASGEQAQVTAAFGGGVTAAYADGIDAAAEILARQDLDAAVLTACRDPDAIERFCRRLRAHPRLFDLPVLLLAAPELAADRGLPYRWGVSDVLHRPLHPATFRLRVQGWVRRQRLRLRLRGKPACHPLPPTQDRLTGLYGHGFLHEYLDDLLRRATPRDPPATLAVFNVVDMARLNQAQGYVAGDRALAATAAAIARTVRASDLVARLGGDEVAVVFNSSDAAGAVAAGERIGGAVAAATAGHAGDRGLELRAGVAEAAPQQSAARLVGEARADSRRVEVRHAS